MSVSAAELQVEFLPERTPTRWRPVWFLVAFYAGVPLTGGGVGSGQESSLFLAITQVEMNFCLAGWAITDSIRRRRSILLLSWNWYSIAAMLLVPLYVMRTRGWLGTVWVFLHVCLYLGLTALGIAVAESQRFAWRF